MSDSFRIPVIGIVGGIGSGKSTIARAAARLKPWYVIDADGIGHAVLEVPEVRVQLKSAFGQTIFDASGAVIRSALAERVFGFPQQENKQQLESIVHPVIRARILAAIREAEQCGQYEAVLLDAAVLLESGWRDVCSAVVYIDASFEDRLSRVRETRDWSEDQLRVREASQLSLDQKKKHSDSVISNSGESSQAVRQLIEFVDSIGASIKK
ncbi:MAG TPA: dephospho-CoA kinase [Planctomycetaceae bacterium]|nr:dephospho-CoA kinase [Planctomycetaceae bacterium]